MNTYFFKKIFIGRIVRFSIDADKCLVRFGGCLHSLFMCGQISSGLWQGLKKPSLRFSVRSTQLAVLELDSTTVSKPKFFKDFCQLFFILSSCVPLLFLNTVYRPSRYKPMLFSSFFSLVFSFYRYTLYKVITDDCHEDLTIKSQSFHFLP